MELFRYLLLAIFFGSLHVVFVRGGDIFSALDDDDESGSGSEEDITKSTRKHHDVQKVVDTMKKMHNAKTNEDLSDSLKTGHGSTKSLLQTHKLHAEWIPIIHKLWKFWHKRGSVFDLGAVNLMTEATGARHVMHTIASKLVSHASNKITNHVGHIIKTSLASRKSDVSSDLKKEKSLSSSTEVVLPALAVNKLTDSGVSGAMNATGGGSNASLATNTSASTNKSAIQRHAIPGGSSSTTGAKEKVKAIGPMEGIEIKINGNANTFSNFTKLPNEPEVTRQNKVDSLNFAKKESLPTKDAHKKSHRKKKLKKNRKSKRSKKSKTSKHFPKIILYQGPISKALENILKARSTSYRSRFINAPMSFEEATADIKRSSISKRNRKASKVVRDDEEESDEEEEDEEDTEVKKDGKDGKKKSKVGSKGQRKYTVKGFQDSSKAVKKSLKKSTNPENGSKKYAVSLKSKNPKQGKEMPVPILTINPSATEADDESKDSLFPEMSPKIQEEGKKVRPYKPLIIPNDDEPQTGQFSDFVKQLNLNVPPELGFNTKVSNRPTRKGKTDSIIIEPPKGNENGPPFNNNKEVPSGENQFEYPNPAGYTTMGDGNVINDREEEDDKEDEEFNFGGKNETNSSQTHVFAPLQHRPQPLNDNSGTPPAVVNSQDFDNEEPPPEPDNSYPKPDNAYPKPDNWYPKPGHSYPKPPIGFPAPAPNEVNGPEPKPELYNAELNSEMMERIESNSHNVASLANEVRDVESRMEEVGTAVNEIEKDIIRIEKKIDSNQHTAAKESFAQFAGPLSSVQGDRQGVKLPFNVLPPGSFPINIMNRKIPFKRPRVLKQFFIPLPPPNSRAAKNLDRGAPVAGLPWPLSEALSYLLQKMREYDGPVLSNGPTRIKAMKARPWQRPHPLAEDSFPPKEHDIDALETELGMKPISRVRNGGTAFGKKPKIIIFSKSPNFFDLAEKPCTEPCQNGGECMGGNVCKCPPMFTGVKCDRATHRSLMPGDIMDLIGPLPLDQEESSKKAHAISLPFVLTESSNNNDDEDSAHQKIMGQVDQSKLVDVLSQFGRPALPELVKRSEIPDRLERYYKEK